MNKAPKWAYRDEAHRVWSLHNPNRKIPYGWALHHIDGDYKNNNITNLSVLTHREHWEQHFQSFLEAKRKGNNELMRRHGQACNFINSSNNLNEIFLSGWTRKNTAKKKQSNTMKQVWIQKAQTGQKMGNTGIKPATIKLEKRIKEIILTHDGMEKLKTVKISEMVERTHRHIIRFLAERPYLKELLNEANYFAAVRAAKHKYNIKF